MTTPAPAMPPTYALPSPDLLANAVARDATSLRHPEERARVPIAVQMAALEREPTTRHELADLLERGIELLGSVAEALDGAVLPERDRGALQALYAVYGRPALPVRDDQVGEPPAGWELLKAYREHVKKALRSVGRIQRRAEAAPDDVVGTGFLVAPNLVMTAAHVARQLGPGRAQCAREGDRFDALQGPCIDWRAEAGRPDAFSRFRIVEFVWEHSDDVALLRIDAEGAMPQHASLPPPLALRETQPTGLDGAFVYVVGYPLRGGEGGLASDTLRRIFEATLGTKQLQPGKALAPAVLDGRLRHDCSTLGGNSGSPVFLLEHGQPLVVGIHVSGLPFHENRAVPAWTLRDAVPAGSLSFSPCGSSLPVR
jgi:Trypsin-like peptidase domain